MLWKKETIPDDLSKTILFPVSKNGDKKVTIFEESAYWIYSGKFLLPFYSMDLWQYETAGYALIRLGSDQNAVMLTNSN